MAESSRRRPPLTAITIVLAVVLFVAINLIASLRLGGVRLDLTEDHLFTLAGSTRQVLADIGEPVTIRLYKTPQFINAVPGLAAHAAQVTELLSAFRQISHGKVRVQTIDVTPFSAAEDEALAHGLHGFNLDAQGDRGYFGLVGTNTVDSVETIPFLDPHRAAFLQYDLTRVVYRLSHPDEPQVAVIDGLDMFGSTAQNRPPWAILGMISQNYRLKGVPNDATAIPAGTDVLLIAHPARLSPALRYAVDQYVLGGGAALVFVDPDAEHSPPDVSNPQVPMNPSSDLKALMAAWGVRMDPDKVVGDRNMALQIVGVAGKQRVVANYLPWLKVDGAAFDKDDPITGRLQIMRISSAGAIDTLPNATTKVTPLIRTTTDSMLIDSSVVIHRPDPNTLLDQFVPSGKRQTLAVRITGPANSAFPNGPPTDDKTDGKAKAPSAAPELKHGDINVIVVADTDLLADNHIVDAQGQPVSSNADFVLNAIDDLAGGDALIGLRGGGLADRPFTRIEAMQREAERSYRATEQRLSSELHEAQQHLAALHSPDATGGDPIAASRAQQAAIAKYNTRIVSLRRQLRDVQKSLRGDIERLETRLRLIDIGLVPALIVLAGIILALWRRVRLARHLRRFRAVQGEANDA